MTGHRSDLKGPQEFQKAAIEANQVALSLSDRGHHIVYHDLFGGSAKEAKGV
jgi:hypothetical protein